MATVQVETASDVPLSNTPEAPHLATEEAAPTPVMEEVVEAKADAPAVEELKEAEETTPTVETDEKVSVAVEEVEAEKEAEPVVIETKEEEKQVAEPDPDTTGIEESTPEQVVEEPKVVEEEPTLAIEGEVEAAEETEAEDKAVVLE